MTQFEVLQQGVKASGNLCVPQLPIVDSRASVKLISEFSFLKPSCKTAVRLQERLLFSDCNVHVWSLIGASRFHQDKRIS